MEERAEIEARHAARALRNAKIEAIIAHQSGQSPTRRAADKSAFLRRLDDELSRAEFERKGWDSPLNYTAIIAFHEELAPEIFEDL